MKQTNRDIGNYVKGRLKIEDNVKHAKNYILLHLKMFSRKPSLATWFIIVVNIMTIPMCFCER